MARNIRNLILLLGIWLATPSLAFADDIGGAHIIYTNSKRITGLKWKQGDQEVSWSIGETARGRVILVYATLEGEYIRPDWQLTWRVKGVTTPTPIVLPSSGEFKLKVPLPADAWYIELIAISLKGDVEKTIVKIYFPDREKLLAEVRDEFRVTKRHFFTPSLGFSVLSYAETFHQDLSQIIATTKFSYQYLLRPPTWDIAANIYYTAIPISSNQPGITARFLGINGRIGFKVPQLKSPYSLTLMMGIYYTTMSVTNDAFGFRNLMGPQIFPVFTYKFPSLKVLTTYLKYSPVGQGFNITSLGNREIAAGFSHTWPNGPHPITGSIDIANLSILVQGSQISSTSYSFSGGYGF